MTLLDELADVPPGMPGPECQIQKLRSVEGDNRMREVLDVVMASGYTSRQKQIVLSRAGFDLNRMLIERHARGACVRCTAWAF